MRNQIKQMLITAALVPLFLASLPSWAANDPSIKGNLRTNIKASMSEFINGQTVGQTFRIYDPVEDKMYKLKLDKLHDGIVKKGDFYVSCADLVDAKGRKFDLDFLVLSDGNKLVATQAVIHSVDGKKRKYHLEN
ncbi:MAG: hypothetical protein BMS9Abin26_0255 [Gammaproteobacteria bacterium]|nr:MAG: hypothetical protein BMS9Abin26_0255 [Gammaproteobacteria bacterium]